MTMMTFKTLEECSREPIKVATKLMIREKAKASKLILRFLDLNATSLSLETVQVKKVITPRKGLKLESLTLHNLVLRNLKEAHSKSPSLLKRLDTGRFQSPHLAT